MSQSATLPGPRDREVSHHSLSWTNSGRGHRAEIDRGVHVEYGLVRACKWPERTHRRVQLVLSLDPVEAVISWRAPGAPEQRRGVAGQFVWLVPANTPHSAEWHGTSGLVVLFVEPEFLRAVCECNVIVARHEDFSVLARCNLRVWHLAEDFRRLCRGGQCADTPLAESMGTLLAASLLRSLHRSGAEGAPGLPNAKLREVLDHIDMHLRETITRAALARIARLGVHSFARQFKQRTGLTPCDYVRRRRTTRALELLENSSLKRSAIAGEVGFYDQSHMLKQIRRLRAEEMSSIHEYPAAR